MGPHVKTLVGRAKPAPATQGPFVQVSGFSIVRCYTHPVMPKPVLLTTERLVIREFSGADLGAFLALAADPEVVRYLTFGAVTEAEAAALLDSALAAQRAEPRMSYALAVIERSTGGLIGSAGLELSVDPPSSAETYYAIRKDSWGMGYATEATHAVMDYGFRTLGLHRIWAHAVPGNRASIRVMEKAGMSYEGLTRGVILLNDVWHDAVQYAILDSDPREPIERYS